MKLWNRLFRIAFRRLLYVGKFSWIISEENDPGFRLFGVNVYFYKWSDAPLIYGTSDVPEPGYRICPKHGIIPNSEAT